MEKMTLGPTKRMALIGLAIAVSFVSTRASDIVWWFVVFSFALVPLAFLAGLLQIRLARASVAVLVVELLSADGLRELRDAIARTLNDPDLDLAVWLPDTYEWIGSDGRPYDHDYGDSRYAREDTKMALRQSKVSGIIPFCITIDRESEDELRDLYGEVGYTIIDDVMSLPERLPGIYRRLTT